MDDGKAAAFWEYDCHTETRVVVVILELWVAVDERTKGRDDVDDGGVGKMVDIWL